MAEMKLPYSRTSFCFVFLAGLFTPIISLVIVFIVVVLPVSRILEPFQTLTLQRFSYSFLTHFRPLSMAKRRNLSSPLTFLHLSAYAGNRCHTFSLFCSCHSPFCSSSDPISRITNNISRSKTHEECRTVHKALGQKVQPNKVVVFHYV